MRTRKPIAVLALSLAVLASGCRSNKYDALPEGLAEPPEHRDQVILPWPGDQGEIQGGVLLNDLLERAKRNNARIIADSWRVQQAVARRNEVIARGFTPTLTGEAGVNRRSNQPRNQVTIGGIRTSFKTGVTTVRTINLLATQPIVSISTQLFRTRQSQSLVNAQAYNRHRTEQEIRRLVLTTAFDLLALEEQKASVNALIKSLKLREREAEVQVKAGSQLRNRVLTVQVERVNQEQILFELQSAIKATKSLLCALIGSDESQDFNIIWQRKVDENAKAPRFAEAFDEAVQSRPDIAALRSSESASWEAQRAEWADYLPTIAAQGGWQYNSTRQLAEDDFFFAALVAQVELIDFSRHARIKAARSEAKALRHDRLELVRQTRAQVHQRCLAVENEISRIRLAKVGEAAARENLRVQAERFKNGALTSNDVLDAEVNLLDQQFNLIRARTQYFRALAELDFAVGKDGYAFQLN